MGERRECAVVIMAKAPRPGEVKTRLCPPLSYEEAAELYRCFLLDKVEQLKALHDAAPAIAYSPDNSRTLFEALAPSSFALIPQRDGDLGARLATTIHQLLSAGYPKVMAIDSDTPTLPLAYLQRASALLGEREVDLVLGPSEDGGYYLIGVKNLHRELFEHMNWSTPQVFSETLRRAEAKGLKVACLPTWYDVDRPQELERLKASLRADSGGAARHTKQFFMERGI